MSQGKSSNKRRRWKLDSSRSVDLTIERIGYSNYSFANETAPQLKSSSTPLEASRTRSKSINEARSDRCNSKQISDESGNEVNSDNLTYTKYASDTNKKSVDSPVNSIRKVEEYLMKHENQESESPDNEQARKHKRRKSKKQRKAQRRSTESKRTEDDDAYDDRLTETRESGGPENNAARRRDSASSDNNLEGRLESASPQNNSVNRETKRRRWKKERKDKAHISKSRKTLEITNNEYDEDGLPRERQESPSPENDLARREKRRKSRKERGEKISHFESNKALENDAYDENGHRSTERRESESTENNLARGGKQRKSRKNRKEKIRTLESSRTHENDAYGDYATSDRLKSKKRGDEPRIARRRKRRRSRADSSGGRTEEQGRELPITEVLRKAQENSRNRYEEDVLLPELTTDTIYVQRGNGFSAVKISGNRSARSSKHSLARRSTLYPIKVAIVAQRVWNSMGLIHQGLLAGMALMHILLVQTFFELSLDFLVDYSLISELYTNVFSFLATMCVVSVFDKFDLAHLDLAYLREIYVDHSRSFLAVPLYVAMFCLHQASLLVDDKISLLNYAENSTGFENNSTEAIVEGHLVTWQRVTLAKDSLAVIAWIFVALGPREDMLLTHLKAMERYANSPESSRRDIVETLKESMGSR